MKKNIKKILLLVAVVVTALACFAFMASALAETGQCGDNVTYTYNSITKKLVISGSGNMWDYYVSWDAYGSMYCSSPFFESDIESIVINSGVTNISANAFNNCTNLTDIKIPHSVISIGDDSFKNCDSLTIIIIPDAVTDIGANAFKHCENLKTVILPNMLKNIDPYTFSDCNNLESVIIPSGVTSIGAYAFRGCEGLTYVLIPYGVTKINKNAFEGCNRLTKITIPDSVTLIEEMAFSACDSLESVVIGNSVTKIGDYAFNGCKSLTSIEIPDSVITIGCGSFYDCVSLTDVTIGNGVKNVYRLAFENCTSLKNVMIGSAVNNIGEYVFYNCVNLENVYVADINSWLNINFEDSYSTPMSYGKNFYIGGEFAKTIEIPNGINELKNFVFYSFDCLESITIPDSVTEIGENALSNCKGLNYLKIPVSFNTTKFFSPFADTTNIEEIVFSKGSGVMTDKASISLSANINTIKKLTVEDGVEKLSNTKIYGDSSITYLKMPASLKHENPNVFGNMENLEELVISKGTGEMPGYDSDTYINTPWYTGAKSIKKITIEEGVRNIGSYAFNCCYALENAIIPDSVETIGGFSFSNCANLKNVTIGNSVKQIGRYAFFCCEKLNNIIIPDSVTTIEDRVFYECVALETVTIGKCLTSVGESAFYACNSIEKVYAPNLESWLKISFANINANPLLCVADLYFGGELVTEIEFPNNVTSINSYIFSGCNSINSVIIPDSVTYIGESAFYKCNNFQYLKMPASLDDIGNNAFQYVSNIEEVVLSKGNGVMFSYYLSSIPWYYSKEKLKNVIIEEGIVNIIDRAFLNCRNLTNITIPDSVTAIGEYAFSGCSLTSTTIPDRVTTIGKYAFAGCNSLTSITIPDSVTTIGERTFYNCKSLTSVIIGDGVTTIEDEVFYGCTGLTSVKIPDSVTSIKFGAFYDCGNLISVTIGDGVTAIGRYVFSKCYKLTSVTIGNSVTTIGGYAFEKCTSLTSITIPDSVTTIGERAFYNCNSLTSVIIGDGVTTIEESAYYGCTSLTNLSIGKNVLSIGKSAFDKCSSLKEVYYIGTQQQWEKIDIGMNDYSLHKATIHYNSCEHLNKNVKEDVKPTCFEVGYTAGVYCFDCNIWISGHEEISKLPHTFTEKIIDSAHLVSSATTQSPAIYKYDCANCDAISEELTFTHGEKLNSVLGKTSKITATQTVNSINLSWLPVEGADGYKLFQKIDGKWKDIGNRTVTSSTIKDLTPGTEYTFAVKAGKIVDGKVIWSDTYTTINTATKAVAPSKITSAQNTTKIKLSWNACPGATGYRIYYKSGNTWKTCLNATTATTHTFTGLKAGSKFTFAVRPYIVTDSGVVWSDYTTYTASTLPAIPKTTVTSPSSGKITVKWSAVSGAEAYQLYYKTGNGAYKLYKNYFSVQTVSFSGLKSGTKYTFAVRAAVKTSGGWVFGSFTPVSVTVK